MEHKMQMTNFIALLLLAGAQLAGALVVPARLATRGGRDRTMIALKTAGTDTPSSQQSQGNIESAPSQLADRTKTVRDQMRDAIWKATDSISHALEDLPDFGANANETLLKLGSFVEDIDEKYFSKYLSIGATPTYRETLAAASTATLERDGGVSTATEGTPKVGKAPEKSKNAAKDDPVESAVTGASAKTLDVAAKGVSAAVGTAGAAASTATRKAGAATEAPPKAASKKGMAGTASGTVQLDRPKQVQGVFDEIQKQAVEYYRSTPSGGAVAQGGVATPLPEAVQKLEAQLESLLAESKFKPRKLKKEKRTRLVAAISAMEAAYPADANPLGDPSLSGQWSVVYSSSSKLIGRALRGVLAGFFKTSDARQVVDTGAFSVMNACRARLRMTPLAMRVAKQGSFRAIGDRKMVVDMPPTKKGLLRRLLPSFRPGKVEAEVTYLSNKWRICRTEGVTIAFRKSEG